MSLRNPPAARRLTLLLLLTLLGACAHTPPASQPVPPPVIPPLPPSAKQPAPLELCLPTCSAAWKRAVESLLPKPTDGVSPAPSALPATRP